MCRLPDATGSRGLWAWPPGLGIHDCTHHLYYSPSSASSVCSDRPTSRWTDVWDCGGCFTGCRLKGRDQGSVKSALMLTAPPALHTTAQPCPPSEPFP